MENAPDNFLGIPAEFADAATASAVILPVPYEGGISWLPGAAKGPLAILEASKIVEFYDEVYGVEPHKRGIATLAPVDANGTAEEVHARIYREAKKWIDQGRFLVTLGGDHSVTGPVFRAAFEAHPGLSCVQLDAHADLRDEYEGSKLSHACVMSRVRDLTSRTLQLGIRSMDAEQARRVQDEGIDLVSMHRFREPDFNLEKHLSEISDTVYLTIDVDAFDLSVIRSTGTPEPGGFTWDEGIRILEAIFRAKNVVACDVVELCGRDDDPNTAYSGARLVHKLLSMKFGVEHIERIGDLE